MKIITKIICCLCTILLMNGQSLNADIDYEVTASVRESYDDNITYEETGEIDDFVTALSLGGKATYETRAQKLDLSAKVTEHLYFDNDDFNYYSQDLRAGYLIDVSKYLQFEVTDRFTHSEEPRSFDDTLGRTAGRYSYYQNTFNLTGTADLNQHLQVSLGYRHDMRELSKASAGPDSSEHSGRGSLLYYFDTSNIMTLYYEYAVRSYDPGSEIKRHTIFLNGRHYFKDYFYADAGVGYDVFDSQTDVDKPQYSLSLTNEFSETTYVTAAFSQRYAAQSYSEDLFDEWRTSLTFGHQLLERLNLSFTGFVGRGEYEVNGSRDTFYGVTGELGYDITEKIRGYLSYSHRTVDSNRTTREYERNLLALGVSMTFS